MAVAALRLVLLVAAFRSGDRGLAQRRPPGSSSAEEIAAALAKGPLDGVERDAFLAGINDLDERLTRREDNSPRIWARQPASRAISQCSGWSSLLLTVGIGLAWRTLRFAIRAERRLARSGQCFRDFAEVASDWFWETGAQNRPSISPCRI